MSHPEPSWDLYRSFAAVLGEGSLSAAARALGLTQPTLARHIGELETALGVVLFVRSPRGLDPTDAALELAPHARSLVATAAAFARAASGAGRAVEGVVRVTASEVVGGRVLPPILAGLRARFPGLVIELALSNAVEDLLRRDADIAVRMVEPAQQALTVRRLGRIEIGLHAHERYLAAHGSPATLAELERHPLIGFDTLTPALRVLSAQAPGLSRERFALRTDSDLAQFAAIEAGFGIGTCQVLLAAHTPGLVRLLPEAFRLHLPVCLAMHEDLRGTARCRAVFDHLAEGLNTYIGV
jgi:DNA-binding transcriptional LysR family regulator